MTAIGFTEKEAASFENLWKNTFFYPTHFNEFSRLSYRLPQTEAEKITLLNFNPKPRKVLRSIWIMVNIEKEIDKMES